jgi:hypothetical protein
MDKKIIRKRSGNWEEKESIIKEINEQKLALQFGPANFQHEVLKFPGQGKKLKPSKK